VGPRRAGRGRRGGCALATFEYGGGISVIGVFLGLFAALGGLALGGLAYSRYAAAVLESAAEQLAFEAGWPTTARNRLYAVAGVVAGLSAIGWVAGVVAGPDWLATLGQLGFSLGLVTSVAARSRTYRVTSAGLAVDEPLRTRVVPWSAFEGWDRTDDAIVVRRPRRVDVRVAADDLEDPTPSRTRSPATSDRRPELRQRLITRSPTHSREYTRPDRL